MNVVYLLHFINPIHPERPAQHYVGWSNRLSSRIEAHLQNRSQVAIIKASHQKQIPFLVARCWKGDRKLERYLKSLKNAPKFCPYCSYKPWVLYRPHNGFRPAEELTGTKLKEAVLFN